MKTILTVKIEMSDDGFDKIERLSRTADTWSLELLENIIQAAIYKDLGVVSKTTVAKIE